MLRMQLVRQTIRDDGVFGELLVYTAEGQIHVCYTLEHVFIEDADGMARYVALLKTGKTYLCERGIHKLEHGAPFGTFEIMGVTGHSGVLFHKGNFNEESKGCILLGDDIKALPKGWAVADSKAAFKRFLSLLEGANVFMLEVA